MLIRLLILAVAGTLPAFSQTTSVLKFEAESMTLPETEEPAWIIEQRHPASGQAWLAATGKPASRMPATYSLEIPSSGTWYLWVRYGVHPLRAKPFSVTIQGEDFLFAEAPYGTSPEEKPESYGDRELEGGNARLIWTRRTVELKKGKAEVELRAAPERRSPELFQDKPIISHGAAVDLLILTNDPDYTPPR
jgi:hypothetical protein